MHTALNDVLSKALADRTARGVPVWNLDFHSTSSQPGDLFSNDYLSFSTNSQLRSLFVEKLSVTPNILGSMGSRLLGGNSNIPHLALENRLREFYSAPAALLFNSGFHANECVLGSLPQSGDIIIFDEYIHASCHDGMKMSRANNALISFKHNSLSSLKECILRALELNPGIKARMATVFVVVEGLYSMDGDVAPLKEIVELMKSLVPPESRHLIVDEAHSGGIYGQAGRGLVSLNGLEEEVHTRVHTFGKASGSAGAVVLTNPVARLYLINYARSFIYTTSLPLFNVVAIGCSFDMLELVGDELSARLMYLCRFFQDALSSSLKPIPPKIMTLTNTVKGNLPSPIFPILVCDPINLEECLQAKGYHARAMCYPVVPRGAERIRVCIHAANTEDELLRFITELVSWAAAYERNAGNKEWNAVSAMCSKDMEISKL